MFGIKNLFQNKYYIVIDQVLGSLLNFGSIFLLSKLASISIFAKFVLIYGYSNLIFILATYFVSAPILVFFPKKKPEESSPYLASLIALNILSSLLLSLIGFWVVQLQVGNISFWAFLGINFSMIVHDLFKKFIFAQNRMSFIFTVFSSILLVLTFFGLTFYKSDSLELNTILEIYTISFLVASVIMLLFIGKNGFLNKRSFIPSLKNIKLIFVFFLEHYTYSKWIIMAGILFWGYSQGIFILGDILGVSELGISKTRTIQNLLGLFTILIMSMESYFLPSFSRQVDHLRLAVRGFYSKFTSPLLIVFLLSIPVLYFAYYFVYEEKYGSGIYIMGILLLSQAVVIFTKPLSIALKATEISYPLFIAHLMAILGLISLGSLFIYLWEDIGIAMTLFLAYFLSNLVVLYYYKKNINE
jgi:O-antigen/teichoic acid export membrane protein